MRRAPAARRALRDGVNRRPTVDPVVRAAEYAIQTSEMLGVPLTRERVATLIIDMGTLHLIKKRPAAGRVWHYLCQTSPQHVQRPGSEAGEAPPDGQLAGEAPTVEPIDLDAL